MLKKITYIGVALMLIALVVIIVTALLLNHTIGSKLERYNLTVGAHNYTYVKIVQNTTLVSMVYEVSSGPSNLYVVNSSVLAGMKAYLSGNPSASAYSYITSAKVDPNDTQLNSTHAAVTLYNLPSKAANKTDVLYVVLDNTKGSSSATSALNATVLFVKFNPSAGIAYSLTYIVCIIVFIAGIVVTVYGLLKKDSVVGDVTKPMGKDDQEYIDSLYKNVDKGKTRKRHRNRKTNDDDK